MMALLPASSTSLSLLLFLTLLSLPLLSLSEHCHPNDKKVLLQIKQSLANAYDFASWKPDTDCCSWDEVKCHQNTYRVIEFATSDASRVPCKIPAAVADLPYLETLIIHKNRNLTGTIPPAIAKLTRLINLDFSENRLSGPVPSFLVKLKNMNYLTLSFNKLSGTIPPEFSQFPKIEAIRLGHNALTGPIPESFGAFVGTAPALDLSHNRLTGPVPKSLGKLKFGTLDFSGNLLTGDVSHLFGSGKSLEYVDFSKNAFEFDLTKVVFPKSLTWLDLKRNKINGSLPASLTGLKLRLFDVSYNKLCGKIPIGGDLQLFGRESYAHNLCLCDSPLPPC